MVAALLGTERVLATVNVNFSVEIRLLNISVLIGGCGCIDEPSIDLNAFCVL